MGLIKIMPCVTGTTGVMVLWVGDGAALHAAVKSLMCAGACVR